MSYLGYRDNDADTPFGRFYNPDMAALPRHVVLALEHGPQADPVLPDFEEPLAEDGYQQTENGYGSLPDGGYTVAVRTDMPGVTPEMWEWWFGWHGCDPRRYKLWHPRAHVSAGWRDGRDDLAYIGRTSLVQEYIGSAFTSAAIQFVAPDTLGHLGIAIAARLGSPDLPVDTGWLVHQVRPTPDGAEMRSRFWMGGRNVNFRLGNSLADRAFRVLAARQLPDPRDLMVHRAQEMNHLAGFLPELHAEFA